MGEQPGSRSPYDWLPPRPVYDVVKRATDITFSAVILSLLGPIWLLLAVAVRLTSPGPALFRRTVVGRRGRPFTYYKFRSMVSGDDSHHRDWLRQYVINDKPYAGRSFKVVDDPRLTRLGRWLRKTSLDEVPQFINVLCGEMSVVGPRPPIAAEFELYNDAMRRRLAVRPGITGLYQVTERGRAPFSRMLALDLEYITRRSLALDLSIMVRTAAVMVTGRGAA